MKLMIVDDHEVVRGGLLAMLGSEEGISIAGAVATGEAALELAAATLPDVAVVDLRLPDMSGEQLCRELLKNWPDMAIVVLSTYLSEEAVRTAVAAGAAAYVTKSAGVQRLRDALHEIRQGARADVLNASHITRELHDIVNAREGVVRATPQQSRVLELAAQGLTNKQIGARLFISESTVRFHLQKLKEITASRTRTELIARAIRNGMIAPHEDDSSVPTPE